MERPTLSPVNPSGLANPSSAPPLSGVAPESTAAASRLEETTGPAQSGTSEHRERGGPAVTIVPPPSQRLESTGRNEPAAPLPQSLIPVLQSSATQSTPERTVTLAARPATEPTPPTRQSLPHIITAHPASVGHPGSSSDKLEDVDTLSGFGYPELHRDSALRTDQPVPVPPQARVVDNGPTPTRRQHGISYGLPSSLVRGPGSRRSNLDWVVPVDEKRKKTVTERLQPTLDVAVTKRDKYAAKAKASGWSLNTAIGLQVLFGSITTGLSAVGTTGRSTAVQTTVLGALSTLAASYLARTRGSKEPELSLIRVRDLEHFIRDLRAFQLDHGHVDTDEWDSQIDRFRRQLEEIVDGGNRPTSV